jgi:hypothetical protein
LWLRLRRWDGGGYYAGGNRGIFLFRYEKTRPGIAYRLKKLFFPDPFDLVTDKRAQDEDDQKDDNLDKDAQDSGETEINTQVPRNKHKDDPQEEAGNRAIPEEAGVVFLPAVNKAKDNPQDQIQE